MGIAYRKAGDVLVIGKGQLRLLQGIWVKTDQHVLVGQKDSLFPGLNKEFVLGVHGPYVGTFRGVNEPEQGFIAFGCREGEIVSQEPASKILVLAVFLVYDQVVVRVCQVKDQQLSL